MLVWNHLLFMLSMLSIWSGADQAFATPPTRRWERMMVKHSWNAVPQHWESLGHPPVDSSIDLYLALKTPNESALIDSLYEVSNPRHAKYVRPPSICARTTHFLPPSRCRYGAYLSKEQLAELVAPHPDTLSLVKSWLDDHGIPSSSITMTLGGNWMMVSGMPVPRANEILGASYQLYRHVETNDSVVRTVSYSLPEALHGHIQTVVPTTYFSSPRAERSKPFVHPRGVAAAREKEELVKVLPSREVHVTPAYLRGLYKTMGYVPAAEDQNEIGVTGYMMQYPNPQDLRAFMTEFRTDGENATFSPTPLNGGGYDPGNPGLEANLDLQLAEAMTYPTPNIFYSTGGVMGTITDPYVHWIAFMLGQIKVPQTVTTSYNSNEDEVPRDYAVSLCVGFAYLGIRGVSVLFSTGDWGVGPGDCLIKDSSGDVSVHFRPQFPASCTCGGVYLNSQQT